MFIMFGISNFAWLVLSMKEVKYHRTVAYNYLFNSHVLDLQAGPITQVRPTECLNNLHAIYYFFKELVSISEIK